MKILKKRSKFVNYLSNKKECFGECQFEKYLSNMNILIKGGKYKKKYLTSLIILKKESQI